MSYILLEHKPSVMLNSYSSGDELFEVLGVLSDFHLDERPGIYSTSGTPFINTALWIVTRVTESNGLCILLWKHFLDGQVNWHLAMLSHIMFQLYQTNVMSDH